MVSYGSAVQAFTSKKKKKQKVKNKIYFLPHTKTNI